MDILIGLLVVCALWAVVASLLIAVDLRRRGLRVSFLWLRLLILQYLARYRRLTRLEGGRVGPLFYHSVVPLNLALVLVLILLERT